MTSTAVVQLSVRLDANGEGQAVGVDRRRLARRDDRLAPVGFPHVGEHEAPTLDPSGVLALLLESILDLEQVGEVTSRLDPNRQIHWLVVVIQDRQLLVESMGDSPATDHRELRVDVDRSGSRNEEEAGFEVLQVVRGECVQPIAVHGEDPLREEARIEREEAGRVGERRLDVSIVVADDERVPVEDLDQLAAHARTVSSAASP